MNYIITVTSSGYLLCKWYCYERSRAIKNLQILRDEYPGCDISCNLKVNPEGM